MNPMTQAELAYISTTIHKLKGAPFTLLITLAMCGGPMSNLDFQLVTGYSNGTVTSAIKKLTLHRMVVNTGKPGWVLSDGMRQLPLFTEAMLDSGIRMLFGEGGPVAEEDEDHKIYDLRPSSSSSISINSHGPEEEEKKPQHHKIYDLPDRPVDNSEAAQVEAWLIRAGIGRNSPKLREILDQNHTPAHVQAWVEYYEWWQEQRRRRPRAEFIDGRKRFTIGTLITCLTHCDPAPAVPQETAGIYGQYIPPEYEDIIKR